MPMVMVINAYLPKKVEVLRLFAEGFLVTEIAKNSIVVHQTISIRKSAMMKPGVDNDIALLNYLSSVTIDKEINGKLTR